MNLSLIKDDAEDELIRGTTQRMSNGFVTQEAASVVSPNSPNVAAVDDSGDKKSGVGSNVTPVSSKDLGQESVGCAVHTNKADVEGRRWRSSSIRRGRARATRYLS